MKQNQKGFSIVEILLAIVVICLIAFGAWHIGKQSNNTDDETTVSTSSKPENQQSEKAESKVDETANWFLYKSPNNNYEIRLADGWELVRYSGSDGLVARSGLDYKPGVKATVTELEGGRGGPFPFYIVVLEEPFQVRGKFQGEFKTNSGLIGKKYTFIQESPDAGHDLQPGEKEYTYHFNKDEKYIYVNHSVTSEQKDNVEIVEKSIKTLKIY